MAQAIDGSNAEALVPQGEKEKLARGFEPDYKSALAPSGELCAV
jgi:hypothetical protein